MKNRADAIWKPQAEERNQPPPYRGIRGGLIFALSRYPSLRIELITFLAQLELEDIIPAHYAERLTGRDLLTA